MQFKSIRTPLIAALCLIVAVPLLVLWGVITYQSQKMTTVATEESLKLAYADLDHILDGVLGMLRTQVKGSNDAALRAEIMGIKVGSTGYVYVLDTSGHYVVSQDGKRDGENIWEAKDASGDPLRPGNRQEGPRPEARRDRRAAVPVEEPRRPRLADEGSQDRLFPRKGLGDRRRVLPGRVHGRAREDLGAPRGQRSHHPLNLLDRFSPRRGGSLALQLLVRPARSSYRWNAW